MKGIKKDKKKKKTSNRDIEKQRKAEIQTNGREREREKELRVVEKQEGKVMAKIMFAGNCREEPQRREKGGREGSGRVAGEALF